MKKATLITVLALVALNAATSCRNGKSTMKQTKQAEQEILAAYRADIADSVLEAVDSLAQQYIANIQDGSLAIENLLTERERLVKPKYLFNPADADRLITRRQKTAALAFLITERPLRIAYGMPVNDTDHAIARLLSDLNYPLDIDRMKELSISDNTRNVYEMCREKKQVQYFWEVQADAMISVSYLIASNPDLYYSRLTDEQIRRHAAAFDGMMKALERIARTDREMESVLNDFRSSGVGPLITSQRNHELTAESFIRFHVENSGKMTARRNGLLR